MRILLLTLLWIVSLFSYAEKSQPIQGKLANGLTYSLLPLHQEKGHLEIKMKVYAGSIDETEQQMGVAHMLEHLVFHRSEKYQAGIMPFLHKNKWVRGQNYNAVTTYDSTTYMMTPPAHVNLAQSLDVLSQMLFAAQLTEQDLNQERKIIMEEWRAGQSVGNTMNRQRSEVVRANSRYARWQVIGTPDSIQSMPASRLRDFYQRWYVPNNMQLLIMGDFQPAQAIKLIEHYFAHQQAAELPHRDYYEPQLTHQLQIKRLQDERSAVSQVAYIVRFNEPQRIQQDQNARYQRLLDRFALALLTQRLRHQQAQLPEGVKSLVVRKSEIGKTTAALGIFASVENQSHVQGLKQIFQEIIRLKRFPITENEFAQQKALIQQQISQAEKHTGDRSFAQWAQVLQETLLADKPYLSQPEIAKLTQPLLDKLTLAEVNQRIQFWLSQPDRIVQYQPPRNSSMADISLTQIEQLQQQTEQETISPPKVEEPLAKKDFPPLKGTNAIKSETRYPTQRVIEWQLTNGDKIIWLKLPQAANRSYIQVQNSAGFQAKELSNWQSQVASQLITQNAPPQWQLAQLNEWKKQHQVNLAIQQNAEKLIFTGNVENNHLADWLRLFYAYQWEIPIQFGLADAQKTLKEEITLSHSDNLQIAQQKALQQLRYGKQDISPLPSLKALSHVTLNDLNQQWHKMMSAPMQIFIVNDLDEKQMKALINQYVVTQPRPKTFNIASFLPISGKAEQRFAINPEPKDDVQMWFFTPHQWKGEDAMIVSLLNHVVTQKLKLALRDQSLGIYSLRFTSRLNPTNQRIESELRFTANPENTDKLIQQAKAVLKNLSATITQDDIEQLRNQFLQAEKQRTQDPSVWLNRLILSEEQLNGPQYLSEMTHLAQHIQLDKVQQLSQTLYNEQNQRIFISTQKGK